MFKNLRLASRRKSVGVIDREKISSSIEKILDAYPAGRDGYVSIRAALLQDLVADWRELQDELGLQRREAVEGAFRSAFGLSPHEGQMLTALWLAPRHTLSFRAWYELFDRDVADEANSAKILICRLRRKLGGMDRIELIWNTSWRLTEIGQAQLQVALDG